MPVKGSNQRMQCMAAKVLLLTMEYHHPPCYVPDMSTGREKKFITYSFSPQILHIFWFYCALHYKATSGTEDGVAKHK